MLVKQECAHCKRLIPVRGDGRLFDHYPKHGIWHEGNCVGSGKTVLQTRNEREGKK